MKIGLKSFLDFTLGASDGEIGTIKEMYFDDQTWKVKYFVVETGSWLLGRIVLISPEALLELDWENAVYHTNLSIKEIKESPDVNTQLTVSSYEVAKDRESHPEHFYLGMATAGILFPPAYVPQSEPKEEKEQTLQEEHHLRSSKTVNGYKIHATDGEQGEVDDFVIDTADWRIEFLVVDTGVLFSSRKLILLPENITEISWSTSRVIVNIPVETLNNSQEFDEKAPVNVVYEKNLRDYYGHLIK